MRGARLIRKPELLLNHSADHLSAHEMSVQALEHAKRAFEQSQLAVRRNSSVAIFRQLESAARRIASYRDARRLPVAAAPRSTNSCETALRRQLMARCRGVAPLLSRASIGAPQSSNALAIPA
jgi:hypothetical protein